VKKIDLSNMTVTYHMNAMTNGIYDSVIRQYIVETARQKGLSYTQVIKNIVAEKMKDEHTTRNNERAKKLHPVEIGGEEDKNGVEER